MNENHTLVGFHPISTVYLLQVKEKGQHSLLTSLK